MNIHNHPQYGLQVCSRVIHLITKLILLESGLIPLMDGHKSRWDDYTCSGYDNQGLYQTFLMYALVKVSCIVSLIVGYAYYSCYAPLGYT